MKSRLQTLNVVKNYTLSVEKGFRVFLNQIVMPLRSGPTKKIVSLQQMQRDAFTEPYVIARLLPNVQEQVSAYLEFHGPALLNFIVDCEDENDRFVQIVLDVVGPEVADTSDEEEEEESEFELE